MDVYVLSTQSQGWSGPAERIFPRCGVVDAAGGGGGGGGCW